MTHWRTLWSRRYSIKKETVTPDPPTLFTSVANLLGWTTIEMEDEDSGVDRLGRPVVVFIGKWFPFNKINLDKLSGRPAIVRTVQMKEAALLYLIMLLDPIVKGDYVIAYFHTLTSNSNYPSFSWLKDVYNVLPYKYKKNLKAFYIVHPTFWTKMMTWWFTTFMAPAIKQKVHSLPGVEYLYTVMSPDQLEIPAFITEYDMTVSILIYYCK
nr:unnamed protein product [Callosobruchus chinensis]